MFLIHETDFIYFTLCIYSLLLFNRVVQDFLAYIIQYIREILIETD